MFYCGISRTASVVNFHWLHSHIYLQCELCSDKCNLRVRAAECIQHSILRQACHSSPFAVQSLLLPPGIVEHADLIAINKADGAMQGAALASVGEYASAMHFVRQRYPFWASQVSGGGGGGGGGGAGAGAGAAAASAASAGAVAGDGAALQCTARTGMPGTGIEVFFTLMIQFREKA